MEFNWVNVAKFFAWLVIGFLVWFLLIGAPAIKHKQEVQLERIHKINGYHYVGDANNN